MTTGGEGGMVTTNDKSLWEKMWSYKDHGKSFDAVYNRQHPPGFRWLHESFGTNWRMLEMQAVIGRIQLKRMPAWRAARTESARMLAQTLSRFDAVRIPVIPDYITHAHYKFYVFVRPEKLKQGWSRDRILQELNDIGVPAMQGSCSEVYLEKAFDNSVLRPSARLRVAKELGETSVMFLVHPTITQEQMQLVCQKIEQVFGQSQG